MASNKLTELVISFSKRNVRLRGPTSSHDWNETVEELSRDLSSIHSQWNNSLIPLFSVLPDGDDYPTVDPFAEGLDGRTMYVNADSTASNAVTYYNSGQSRPNTLYEQYQALYSYIDTKVNTVQDQVDSVGLAAVDVPIEDSGGVFSSTNVENALQEIMTLIATTGTDHGTLTGLGDDDHTQYLPRSGTRAMTGNLNMGNKNITSVGNITTTSGSYSATSGNITTSTGLVAGATGLFATSLSLGSTNIHYTRYKRTAVSDNVITTVLTGTDPTNTHSGGCFRATFTAESGSNYQSYTQLVTWAVYWNGTTPVISVAADTGFDVLSASTGSISTTWSATNSGTSWIIRVTANTTLNVTMFCNIYIMGDSTSTGTIS